jgi:molybdate transport system regulatory protein
MSKKNIEIGYKIWLEKNGMAFGSGHYQLLKIVDVSSSLSQAALSMRMSYRQAWGMIRDSEEKLGFALIERQVGGASGGHSILTPEGKEFLFWYEKLYMEISKAVEKIYSGSYEKYIKSSTKT